MAVMALRGRGSVAELIDHLRGSSDWLADYLADEVLDQQTPALRRFLLETSILDEFDAQLCAAVTGDDSAYARLDEIARADLFLIQLDAGKRWFRYHHLFQELLQHRLRAQAEAGVVAELHRRAAAWLAGAGEMPTAVRHRLAAGDQDQAAALVESQIGATLLHAPFQARALLALIPHEVLVQRPQLMLDRCRLGQFFDDKDTLPYAEEAARTLQERQSSDPDAARHHAELLVFRSAAYHTHRNVSAAAADFHQAQAHVAHLDEFHRAMLRFVEMALHGYAGRMAEMEQAAEAVLEAFERIGFDLGNVGLRRELAKWSMRAGNSGQATRRFEELFQNRSWDPLNVARELVLSYFPAIQNSYWQNHLAQAQSYQRSALELAVQLQDTDLIHAARCLGRILGEDGEVDRVSPHALSEDLRRVITPGVADLLLDCQTRFLIATGRSDLAWQIVQDSGANLQNLPKNHVHRRMITCLRTHIARGVDLEAITPALAEALAIATEHNHRLDQLQLLALAAWQQLQLGGLEAARETLQQAAQLAQETGYVRVLLDIPALAPADWSDDEALAASLGEVKGLLTKREHDVLALLAEDLTYAQIGEELVISLSTVRAHVNRIYKKLAVHRRDQAVQRAREFGLLRPSPSDFT
jgi:LuxR family maltose regulon positive regulatory protein